MSETYGITSYGSGWRKDVKNLRLEFEESLGHHLFTHYMMVE